MKPIDGFICDTLCGDLVKNTS